MSNSKRIITNHLNNFKALRESTDKDEWLRSYGYYLLPHPTDFTIWYAILIGAEDTAYTGAFLPLRITFPPHYPFRPPKIENMARLSARFNDNLWGADDHQSLMCSDGEYRVFHGLICMDILNTPHSKVVTNAYGENVEVYDKSREIYTPALNIGSILLSIRSMIMTGETKLAHLDEASLSYLVFTNLVIGVGSSLLDLDDSQILYQPGEKDIFRSFQEMAKTIIVKYQDYYHKTSEALAVRLTEGDRSKLGRILKLPFQDQDQQLPADLQKD